MQELIGDYESFIRNISVGLDAVGIDRSEIAEMDHICFRVETLERYSEMLSALGSYATLLGESPVNGRNIAVLELNDYLNVDGWTVPYLELPEPKEGSFYPEGLQHAELVVIGGLQRFKAMHSELDFTDNGMIKTLNPELGLLSTGLSVKFHEQQLGAVVRTEQRLADQQL